MKKTKREILEGVEDVAYSRFIGNNTVEYRTSDGSYHIRLHNTTIVVQRPDGSIVLDSDGWRTPTTKNRMNEFLRNTDFSIFQNRSVWYLVNNSHKWIFQDGITIHPNGSITGAGEDNHKLLEDIDKYVKGYMALLSSGQMEPPGAGDCFYCYMREVNSNKPLGEVLKDKDHLLLHFEEKYFVPSIVANAIKVFPVSQVALWSISAWFKQGEQDLPDSMFAVAKQQITSSLRRYLRRQLGFAA